MFEELLRNVPATTPRPPTALPGLKYRNFVPLSVAGFALAFAVLFITMPLTMIRSERGWQLAHDGKTAQGQVVAAEDAHQCGETGRRITYAFAGDSGVQVKGNTIVCRDSPYYEAKVGDPIPVRYLPSNPATNAIASAPKDEPPFELFAIFPLFFVLIFGSMFAPQVRNVFRARAAFKNGVLTSGRVIFVKKRSASTMSGWGNVIASGGDVIVVFKDTQGRDVETTVWCGNDWLLNHCAPEQSVHIAYLPKSPQKAMMLEAFLR